MIDIYQKLKESVRDKRLIKVLLIPPDGTRAHSGGGLITNMYYEIFTKKGAVVDILPALGTHAPMSREAQIAFYGDIPAERFMVHRFRDGVTTLGEIPAGFALDTVFDKTGVIGEIGKIPIQVSDCLLDPSYDLIISIGQVVPHEVAGMANYTKNIVVGCGGSQFISASHMLGASYGIERILGYTENPVRRLFDYAEEHFLSRLPLLYVLTVIDGGDIIGLFIGRERKIFEQAAALSQKRNITYVDSPLRKCVVNLDADEFRSTWIGNKAVYRTRMAMADGGHLLVIAPGVKSFGEDAESDRIIRKYGFVGRERILELIKCEPDLQNNLSCAAHLIHGSSDGRFSITYAAPLLGKEAVESVGYNYMDLKDAISLSKESGVYYIENPALGLWQVKGKETI